MSILVAFVILVIGFAMLVKGADFFVEGAAGIAARFGIPQLVIGLTIVAMGTSAPEAAVSITAARAGSAGITIGNVVGSNIMNVLLILGISSVIVPIAVQKSTVRYEIPFLLVITAVLAVLGMSGQKIVLYEGVILWVLFLVYLAYLFVMAKNGQSEEQEEEQKPLWMQIIFLILGGIGIVWGSDLTVDSASKIASAFGMDDRLIGLTIVAFGTSLPELVTSVTAARKGKADIAIGNIVGSNIFNILFVLAAAATITPLPYRNEATNLNFLIDNIVALVTALLLWIGVLNKDQKLKRGFGILMLVAYIAYFVYLLVMS